MNRSILCGALLSASLAAPAWAQTSSAGQAAPDPLDARAPVPALAASSALSAYRAQSARNAASGVTPWRQSNEAVHKAGGWKAYAREASRRAP